MHQTLEEIEKQLVAVINQLQTAIPSNEPFGNAHNNWSFPGLTRTELVEEAQSIIDLIRERGADQIREDADARLRDYLRRLALLQSQTIPNLWGSPANGVSAYLLTLEGLRKALAPALSRDTTSEAAAALRAVTTQLRGMESRLTSLEPRTAALATMVERIEKAYNAADQLPTDLESLAEARQTIASLLEASKEESKNIVGLREAATETDGKLTQIKGNAESVLTRCETAYSAATSVGLAAAFTERSDSLSTSMWFWVGGLVAALGAGSYFGSQQLHSLSDLFKQPGAPTSVLVLNLALSLLSVGAPVWFSWLATKQIGQRFRLSEDYAFKASISRAYEGFRREAARLDTDMEGRVLASALNRLDELPLRLVETESHGSPWHELFSSDNVKQAFKTVPGFADQVKDLATTAINAISPSKGKTEPPPAPSVTAAKE
ncbi:hypothetical protein [Ralstonia mojiangensis]|uniref:hypothetical protein n=1 Tax=Ralstonia mojiangensis TaxID=2953895 RepID=UPI0020902457|nr:hypothetical protein [Ralstonia mojiangensis]MCO5410832.1 hypothetical protein [Ralstonia mojiangensis]